MLRFIANSAIFEAPLRLASVCESQAKTCDFRVSKSAILRFLNFIEATFAIFELHRSKFCDFRGFRWFYVLLLVQLSTFPSSTHREIAFIYGTTRENIFFLAIVKYLDTGIKFGNF